MTKAKTGMMVVGGIVAAAIVAYWALRPSDDGSASIGATTSASAAPSDTGAAAPHDPNSVDLSDAQLASVKVEPVADREFPVEKEAVGSIDFNEDMETQVFTPYQGKSSRFMPPSATM
jgi:membrane fusion protein, heavy metal efflux system